MSSRKRPQSPEQSTADILAEHGKLLCIGCLELVKPVGKAMILRCPYCRGIAFEHPKANKHVDGFWHLPEGRK